MLKNTLGPRRKVIRTERVPRPDYVLRFTLECGHVTVRTKHKECATISCEECRRAASPPPPFLSVSLKEKFK